MVAAANSTWRYEAETCTLTVEAAPSALSEVVGQPVVERLRFQLQLQTVHGPVVVAGLRSQLLCLTTALDAYLQQGARQQTRQDAVELVPLGLTRHQLTLTGWRLSGAATPLTLSALQLQDLAQVLQQFAAAVRVLPVTLRRRRHLHRWVGVAAGLVVSVGGASLLWWQRPQPVTLESAGVPEEYGVVMAEPQLEDGEPEAEIREPAEDNREQGIQAGEAAADPGRVAASAPAQAEEGADAPPAPMAATEPEATEPEATEPEATDSEQAAAPDRISPQPMGRARAAWVEPLEQALQQGWQPAAEMEETLRYGFEVTETGELRSGEALPAAVAAAVAAAAAAAAAGELPPPPPGLQMEIVFAPDGTVTVLPEP